MKACWLNKTNNPNLIVFFAGWSFDENPFKIINSDDYDVLIIYDYSEFELPYELSQIENYDSKTLIAWSMGVFTAFKLKDLFVGFNKKIAVNGTITPVDDDYGIPVRMFELTLKHAQKALDGQFYRNCFATTAEFEKYCQNPVIRTVQNRISELSALYGKIKKSDFEYEKFYDCALVSDYDRIIPSENQIKSHNKNEIPYIQLPFGHFLFYNFSGWSEILNADRLQKY